jgi:hypothetical protein
VPRLSFFFLSSVAILGEGFGLSAGVLTTFELDGFLAAGAG